MRNVNKVILNSVVLYSKILINIFISLLTVPIVLKVLGVSDFGLFNLISGVVAMLSFLNSSMTVVTQRYMSVTLGKGNKAMLDDVFNVGIYSHLLIGFIVVVIFEFVGMFLFDGILNIEISKVLLAQKLYQLLIVSAFFSIISVPFDATLNAYEDMVVFSFFSVLDSLLKLLFVLLLLYIQVSDKLMFYGMSMAMVSIIIFCIKFLYVKFRYKQLRIHTIKTVFSNNGRSSFCEMFSYAGWNTLGSIAKIGRNHGISIILNMFYGTIINASYGISNQVNGAISSFSNSLQKAISPQLMQCEGANDRNGMMSLSFILIKLSSFIFGIMAIPLIVEMDQVLTMWLRNVPEYAVAFCRLILLMQLLFQFSSGVALCIDAVGKIKIYRIVLSFVLILNLPFAFILLKNGFPVYSVMILMCVDEILCLCVRLFFAHKVADFPVIYYLKHLFIPFLFVFIIAFLVGVCEMYFIPVSLIRFCIVVMSTSLIILLGIYKLVLSSKEKLFIKQFFLNLLKNKLLKKVRNEKN